MREYAILIPELAWMERIKPLSKQDTTHFQNSAEQNPEALLGKTVIFAELHSEKDHITYHFSRIRSVAVGNDTAIENSSGLPASDEGRFVLLGVDSPLGPEILNTFQDYSMLLELVSAANKSANTYSVLDKALDEAVELFYFYNILDYTFDVPEPTKKLLPKHPEGNVSSQ